MFSLSGIFYFLLGLWMLPGVLLVAVYLYELGQDLGRRLQGHPARPLPSFGHLLENACDRRRQGARASVRTLSVDRVERTPQGRPSADHRDCDKAHEWTLYLN